MMDLECQSTLNAGRRWLANLGGRRESGRYQSFQHRHVFCPGLIIFTREPTFSFFSGGSSIHSEDILATSATLFSFVAAHYASTSGANYHAVNLV